jgi:hypothetical protein
LNLRTALASLPQKEKFINRKTAGWPARSQSIWHSVNASFSDYQLPPGFDCFKYHTSIIDIARLTGSFFLLKFSALADPLKEKNLGNKKIRVNLLENLYG